MKDKYLSVIGFLGMAMILILLFLASSTDLIIKEKETMVYEISVIIDATDDNGWENFKVGMDKASEQYSMDVSFVTLYDDDIPNQQLGLIQREISSGAQGLIINCENEEIMQRILEIIPPSIPIMTIGSYVETSNITKQFILDYEVIAKSMIGQMKGEDMSKNIKLLTAPADKLNLAAFKSKLSSLAEEYQLNFEVLEVNDYSKIKNYRFKETDVLIIPEIHMLAQASKFYAQKENPPVIYGIGFNGNIWHRMEDETVYKTAVADGYQVGYMTIKEMHLLLADQKIKDKIYDIPFFFVEKKNLYDKEHEMLLFPMG